METLAAALVSALDAHEMTMGEFADALRSTYPELAAYIAALFSTASLMEFHDEDRRRDARLVCVGFGYVALSMN